MPERRESAGVISRDEVRHLADLARIDLDDAELDHLAPQLSVILESVAAINGVVWGYYYARTEGEASK